MGAFLIQRAESGHEILAVGLYHSAVGAQNLEPWLDLWSQGSVEMTWVVTPRPRPMTIPPNTHGAAMGYSDAAPYGAGGGIYQRGFLTPEGSHIIAQSIAMGTNQCHFDPREKSNPAAYTLKSVT